VKTPERGGRWSPPGIKSKKGGKRGGIRGKKKKRKTRILSRPRLAVWTGRPAGAHYREKRWKKKTFIPVEKGGGGREKWGRGNSSFSRLSEFHLLRFREGRRPILLFKLLRNPWGRGGGKHALIHPPRKFNAEG